MKNLRLISRILVGIVFIFSGFVKAVDPLGSNYKFIDYFDAFGLEFFNPVALPLALLLSSVEFLIGICLLIGIRIKISSWALFIFMVFFTILTFILAIDNPVTDCGCFGDAIILTNWQTFFKNLILMPFVLVIFFGKEKYKQNYSNKTEWLITGIFFILINLFSIYCIQHLPVLDFRPYRVGTYIPEKMEIPEGAPEDKFEINLYYQKKGKEKAFSLQNLPDTTWEFVRTEKTLIKQGYVPPIHDFTINDIETGEDLVDVILSDSNYTFILITYKLENYKYKNQDRINEVAAFCDSNSYNFFCLTSSVYEDIEKYNHNNNSDFKFYNTDDITLKTIVRSNPGVILIKDGIILKKWHYNDIPNSIEMKNNLNIYFKKALEKSNLII